MKLYRLPTVDGIPDSRKRIQTCLRRSMAYEKHQVVDWVRKHFSMEWASECDIAFGNWPISCYIATSQGSILGFACYDSTSRGMFGPIGVMKSAQGQGIGRGLLRAGLHAMACVGYAYAVIGGVGNSEFYSRVVEVMEIPGSTPGIYKDRLKSETR